MTKNPQDESGNYIARLFRGDIALPVTYWVFGVLLGGVLTRIVIKVIELNYTSLAMKDGGLLSVQIIYWILIAYALFILIAIWRSAGKYKGNLIWAVLARVVVAFNLGLFVYEFWKASDTEYVLKEEIRMMNSSLPMMIDPDTRMERVSLQGEEVYYAYTLVNVELADLDLDYFESTIRSLLVSNVCNEEQSRGLLQEGYKAIFSYRDRLEQLVTEIKVTESDC